jgi:hypothetical protein
MPRQRLGPWGKLYASTTMDTAHYSDRQFRAFVSILCMAIQDRGELPKLAPLRAMYGSEQIDFLISEGRLITDPNGVMLAGWERYQAPVDTTNAERQRRWYSRTKTGSADVDNVLANEPNTVSLTGVPTSTSISIESTETEERPVAGASYPVEGSDEDALDRYYALTGSRPWGKRVGEWIAELQTKHGLTHVVAALEVEAKTGREKLVERVAVRLERMADRVAKAERSKPKPVDPEMIARRAAYEATYGPTERGGPSLTVGTVLSSMKNGQGQPLTDVGRAGSTPPTRGRAESTPSFPEPRGPSGIERAVHTEASTDEATEGDRA